MSIFWNTLAFLSFVGLIVGIIAPRLVTPPRIRSRGKAMLLYGGAWILFGIIGAATASGPHIERHAPNEVDSMYLSEDLLFVGMTADACFAILTPDDVVEQTILPDPELDGSLISTKLYRIDDNEFEVEFKRFAQPGPYLVSRIVIHAGLPAPSD